jgi:hypothetical protein
MKKIKFLFLLISLITIITANSSYGFSIANPTTNTEKYEAVKYLKISELVNLSPKQFSELTGKKMNMWDKVSFSILKIKMKHDLKKNPNLTFKNYYSSEGKKRLGTIWWILIGIAGLLLILVLLYVLALAAI